MKSIGAIRSEIDLLHPIVLVLGLLLVRVHSKAFAALLWPEVRTWEISDRHVETAAAVLGVFTIALIVGAFLGDRLAKAYPFRLATEPRKRGLHTHLATVGVLILAAFQVYALFRIVREYGSVAELFIQQQAIAGGLKEAGLTPYFAIMNAVLIPIQLYLIRMVELEGRSTLKKPLTWLLGAIAIVPFLILSRRSPLLLFALPILYYYHHRIKHVRPRTLLIFGFLAFVALSAIVLVRMQLALEGVDLTMILQTPEYSSFDVLALAVENEDRLSRYADLGYLLSHPEYFREYYLGALIAGDLFGFQLQGGAIPPTLAGSGYLWGGFPGAILFGFLAGGILAYVYYVLKASGHLIIFAGYLFSFGMQVLMNGDLYILGIVWSRLLLVAVFFFHVFFAHKLLILQPVRKVRPWI